jgi:ribulose-phosphate 3-epimerase
MVKIAPSILAADFARLAEEIQDVERGGADWIHIDVMDGHFVPNITIGPLIVDAVRPHTDLPLDVHLMIEQPEKYIADFVRAGADYISVHQEACAHLHRTIYQIKEEGAQAGVVLNPATPAHMIREILPDVDLILLMTVNPGFGGQRFIKNVVSKIETVKQMLIERNLEHVHVQVDGGVNLETARTCIEAGANVLVDGSASFKEKDRAAIIDRLKQV